MKKGGYKLAIVGEAGVGKSSIVERIVRNRFLSDTNSTIGASYSVYDYNGTTYQIWDTAGQERYQALIPMYLRDSKVVLAVYDVNNMFSMDRIKEHWYNFVVKNVDEDCIIILVGNKWDVHKFNTESVSKAAREFASQNDLIHIQVSAKQGTNIASLFRSVDDAVKQQEISKAKFDDDGIEITKDGNGLVLIDWDKLRAKKGESPTTRCTCSIQ